jgi:hypothetical protein
LASIKAKWDRESAEAIKNGKVYKNGKEVLSDLF